MINQSANSFNQTIVSEVELIYRSKVLPSERPIIKRPADSYQIFKTNWNRDKLEFIEQFKVLYLNRGYKVLAVIEISSGGLSGTVVDPRVVFATALKLNATAIVLCHNHPSGNLTPSETDNRVTQKLISAGKLLDILVEDHIIISSEGYYSYAEAGLI